MAKNYNEHTIEIVPSMFGRVYSVPPEEVYWDMYENGTSYEDATTSYGNRMMEQFDDPLEDFFGGNGTLGSMVEDIDEDAVEKAMYQYLVEETMGPGYNVDGINTPYGIGLSTEEMNAVAEEYPAVRAGIDMDFMEDHFGDAESMLYHSGDKIDAIIDGIDRKATQEGQIGFEGNLYEAVGNQVATYLNDTVTVPNQAWSVEEAGGQEAEAMAQAILDQTGSYDGVTDDVDILLDNVSRNFQDDGIVGPESNITAQPAIIQGGGLLGNQNPILDEHGNVLNEDDLGITATTVGSSSGPSFLKDNEDRIQQDQSMLARIEIMNDTLLDGTLSWQEVMEELSSLFTVEEIQAWKEHEGFNALVRKNLVVDPQVFHAALDAQFNLQAGRQEDEATANAEKEKNGETKKENGDRSQQIAEIMALDQTEKGYSRWMTEERAQAVLDSGISPDSVNFKLLVEHIRTQNPNLEQIKKYADTINTSTVPDASGIGSETDVGVMEETPFMKKQLQKPPTDLDLLEGAGAADAPSLTADLRKVFYTAMYAIPGVGNADVQERLPQMYYDTVNLFFLYEPDAFFQTHGVTMDQALTDRAKKEGTSDRDTAVAQLEHSYTNFLVNKYLKDPQAYRGGEKLKGGIREINRLMTKKRLYPKLTETNVWDAEELKKLRWMESYFMGDDDNKVKQNTRDRLVKLALTNGSDGYWAQQLHNETQKQMDHFRIMGWTEAEIFRHFTQGSLELPKRYGHEGEIGKMYGEWEGKTTEQQVKDQFEQSQTEKKQDPGTPITADTYKEIEEDKRGDFQQIAGTSGLKPTPIQEKTTEQEIQEQHERELEAQFYT